MYLWHCFDLQLRQIFPYWVLGMVLGSIISVFAKDHIHTLFRSFKGKQLGMLGIVAASALGIVSPLCMSLAASFSEDGMEDDWLAAFMMTGPATKITNLGALKIVLGAKRFALYLAVTITVFGQSGRSYDDAVVYPFGYGLNCGAEFEQTITSLTEDADSIHLTVRGSGCMNYWGAEWGGACYGLLTGTLRHEWGFQGFVVTDMLIHTKAGSQPYHLGAGFTITLPLHRGVLYEVSGNHQANAPAKNSAVWELREAFK